ncbi:hypothetical protein RKD18_000340 [Streptomyces phaeoluteigriseus]
MRRGAVALGGGSDRLAQPPEERVDGVGSRAVGGAAQGAGDEDSAAADPDALSPSAAARAIRAPSTARTFGLRRGHRPHQPLTDPRIHRHRCPRPSPARHGQRSRQAAAAPGRMGPCRRTPRSRCNTTCASVPATPANAGPTWTPSRSAFAHTSTTWQPSCPAQKSRPLCRLRFTGVLHTWGFALYLASNDSYQDDILPSGLPVGSPEEALYCAGDLYLNARAPVPVASLPLRCRRACQAPDRIKPLCGERAGKTRPADSGSHRGYLFPCCNRP